MKEEFDISDEWVSFEVHPETPAEGILLSEKFAGFDMHRMYAKFRRNWSGIGIQFGNVRLLSNSRLALEASEYARDKGKYDAFHNKIYEAYFVETQDIGGLKVVLTLAKKIGLDDGELLRALKEKRYASRMEQASQEAMRYGVRAVPTFIINRKLKISGAQPLDVFRDMFLRIEAD